MQVARRGRVFHTPGTCQIAYKIIISGKLIFFYWQLLIILFAVDIAKKIWNYTSLCFEKGKIYFWRGNFRRGHGFHTRPIFVFKSQYLWPGNSLLGKYNHFGNLSLSFALSEVLKKNLT